MSANIKALRALFAEHQKTRADYVKSALPVLARYYREDRKRGKPPGEFKDTSFLYIRSYDGDAGVRPFGGITHWHSPDLNLRPLNGAQSYTTTLEAGKTYLIRTILHNRGDIMVPYPKVEFFLTDPSIGFDTRFAKMIGLTQYNGILLADSNGVVDLQYTVDPKEAGHKCLFARTWSFSPPDRPVDLYTLDPRIDRHIAQQNLNIIGQGQSMTFQLIHLPLTTEQIALVPMTRDEVMMTRHPLLADFRIRGQLPPATMRRTEIAILDNPHEAQLERGRSGYVFTGRGKGLALEEQAAVHRRLEGAMAAAAKGKGKREEMKEVRKAYREMNRPMQRTFLKLRVPSLGLEKGEAAGFHLVGTSKVTGQTKGGIAVIVTG